MRFFISLIGAVFWAYAAQAQTAPVSYADTVDGLLPSVVSVSSMKITGAPPEMMMALRGSPFEQFFKELYKDGQFDAPKSILLGSGFIYDDKGHVITSAHVVEKMGEVSVTLNDGSVQTAVVLGKDAKTDLALLKLSDTTASKPVIVGDSDQMRVGDPVLAIGNPFGLGNSVTSGIVSARSRDIQIGPYDDFIQTDAAINRGNSGGPLFNVQGEMIGVNTAIFSPSGGSVGIAFAVPSKIVKHVADALIANGTVKRGKLGVKIQTVTPEIAKTLGLSKPYGALIAGIDPSSEAAKSDLKTGDIVTAFNGTEITNMRVLPRLAADAEIGGTAQLKIWRDGKEKTVSLKISEVRDNEPRKMPLDLKVNEVTQRNVPFLGIAVADITPGIREKYRLAKNIKGVVVTTVSPQTDAASKGLRAGDVLVELDKRELKDLESVSAWENDATEMGQESAFLLIDRHGESFFAVVKFAPIQQDGHAD